MLSEKQIEAINKELDMIKAHREGIDRAIERLEKVLSQNLVPKKTGLGQRAIAEREARMVKKAV